MTKKNPFRAAIAFIEVKKEQLELDAQLTYEKQLDYERMAERHKERCDNLQDQIEELQAAIHGLENAQSLLGDSPK